MPEEPLKQDPALPQTRLEDFYPTGLDTGATGEAPSFRPPVGLPAFIPSQLLGLPEPGSQLGDYHLVRVLGSGSFARVYLARELQLGRWVALKVSRNQSQEATTLASLDHPHIVSVFTEAIDADRGLRLLSMQYVAGTTLERVIAQMRSIPLAERSGRCFLDLIDAQAEMNVAALDIGALRDREALDDMDMIEAACWIGARLAEALAHAHEKGIMHRDVKPANILVNRYGRPLLADFNIATSLAGNQPLGGTLIYMAPEHLDAFQKLVPAEMVNEASDVWSLGSVIYEFLTGEHPYPSRTNPDERKQPPPRLAPRVDASPTLERVMARCLAPRQADRYQSAAALAADLDSCRELRRVHREMPPGGYITRVCRTSPFLLSTLLMLVPQLIASFVNVSYNYLRIIREVYPQHEHVFWLLVFTYNSVAWPLATAFIARLIMPLYKTWQALEGGGALETAAVEDVRRRTLMLPVWAMLLACAAWLPGGVMFPVGFHLYGVEVTPEVFGHFFLSFTLSGMIAVTYSLLAFDFVVIRILYPGLWLEARNLHRVARKELLGHERWLFAIQLAAVLIPLIGATLMVLIGPGGHLDETYRPFSYLVTAFLALGVAGQGMALLTGQRLRETIAVLVASGRKNVGK